MCQAVTGCGSGEVAGEKLCGAVTEGPVGVAVLVDGDNEVAAAHPQPLHHDQGMRGLFLRRVSEVERGIKAVPDQSRQYALAAAIVWKLIAITWELAIRLLGSSAY